MTQLRATLRNLVKFGNNAKAGSAALHAVVTAKGVGFNVVCNTNIGAVHICDKNGKVRTFAAIDDFLIEASKNGAMTETASYNIDNAALYAPKPFTGDIIKKNTALKLAYMTQSDDAGTLSAEMETAITLMQADPTVTVASLQEKKDQKAGVDGLKEWLDAEIVRINAALNPSVA